MLYKLVTELMMTTLLKDLKIYILVTPYDNVWMTCDFKSFATVLQLQQDDAKMIIKNCVLWSLKTSQSRRAGT